MSILDYIFKSQAQKVAEAEAEANMQAHAVKLRSEEMMSRLLSAKRACGKCQYYEDAAFQFGGYGFDGYCKRHPLTETKRALDWCGEYVVDVSPAPLAAAALEKAGWKP